MREVETKTSFNTDLSLYTGKWDKEDLRTLLYYLRELESLPPEYDEHPLEREWSGYMECHLSGDFLVNFKRSKRKVRLYRAGSHTYLFGQKVRPRRIHLRSPKEE